MGNIRIYISMKVGPPCPPPRGPLVPLVGSLNGCVVVCVMAG